MGISIYLYSSDNKFSVIHGNYLPAIWMCGFPTTDLYGWIMTTSAKEYKQRLRKLVDAGKNHRQIEVKLFFSMYEPFTQYAEKMGDEATISLNHREWEYDSTPDHMNYGEFVEMLIDDLSANKPINFYKLLDIFQLKEPSNWDMFGYEYLEDNSIDEWYELIDKNLQGLAPAHLMKMIDSSLELISHLFEVKKYTAYLLNFVKEWRTKLTSSEPFGKWTPNVQVLLNNEQDWAKVLKNSDGKYLVNEAGLTSEELLEARFDYLKFWDDKK